ncbi:F-box-like protein [Ceratobasidium sp. AG-Ba]|nr:F-box-like protein [Ceratobasidium sp. AG-Ba]
MKDIKSNVETLFAHLSVFSVCRQSTPPDSPNFESHNISEAFQTWSSSCTKLAQALNEYQLSSIGLKKAVEIASYDSGSYRAIDQALFGIDLELDSLQSGEEQLAHTRVALSHVRNTSHYLAPIHRLPLETLSTIFILANRRCLRMKEGNLLEQFSPTHLFPTALASVCARWRRIAHNTPALWSHIDILAGRDRVSSDLNWASLWVGRARGLPLDVDVWEYKSNGRDTPRPPDPRMNQATIEFLRPLIGQISEFRLFISSQSLLDALIGCWSEYSPASGSKSLQVLDWPFAHGHTTLRVLSERSQADQFNNAFRTCHALSIRKCEGFSRVMFHEGLLELRLEGLDMEGLFPSKSQLAAALAAAPNLRTLAMNNVQIVDPKGVPNDFEPRPVIMNHLNSLTLERLGDHRSEVTMFKLLVVRSELLRMIITLSDDAQVIAAAHSFFSRTKVTALHVGSCLDTAPLPLDQILCPMPYLEEIAIAHCQIKKRHLSSIILPQPNGQSTWISGKGKPMGDHQCHKLKKRLEMVQDLKVESGLKDSPSINWDFVIMP